MHESIHEKQAGYPDPRIVGRVGSFDRTLLKPRYGPFGYLDHCPIQAFGDTKSSAYSH